jgi:hypothetical protein
VRFSTRGVKKHQKNFLGEVHVKNFWPKKLRGGKKSCLFPLIFFIAFLAVSLHEGEPKNTTILFPKSDLKISTKSQQKAGRYVAFFFFFLSAPCKGQGEFITKTPLPKTTGKKEVGCGCWCWCIGAWCGNREWDIK